MPFSKRNPEADAQFDDDDYSQGSMSDDDRSMVSDLGAAAEGAPAKRGGFSRRAEPIDAGLDAEDFSGDEASLAPESAPVKKSKKGKKAAKTARVGADQAAPDAAEAPARGPSGRAKPLGTKSMVARKYYVTKKFTAQEFADSANGVIRVTITDPNISRAIFGTKLAQAEDSASVSRTGDLANAVPVMIKAYNVKLTGHFGVNINIPNINGHWYSTETGQRALMFISVGDHPKTEVLYHNDTHANSRFLAEYPDFTEDRIDKEGITRIRDRKYSHVEEDHPVIGMLMEQPGPTGDRFRGMIPDDGLYKIGNSTLIKYLGDLKKQLKSIPRINLQNFSIDITRNAPGSGDGQIVKDEVYDNADNTTSQLRHSKTVSRLSMILDMKMRIPKNRAGSRTG
jgi:hypothetical protein